ncbi:unnamed protein product, partial [Meganyctiphanes norvegica]
SITMAYNGDGSYNKRMRTDGASDNFSQKNGSYGYQENENPARRWKGEPEAPNHIILMTVLNPAYPITVDVIHQITKTFGDVQRIVIFKKRGVQAMVEFENIDIATSALEGLQGADIYSGCCTLRVEYGKAKKLNVYKNDSESWDFTTPVFGGTKPHEGGGSSSGRPPLLQEPRGFGGGGMGGPMGQGMPGRNNFNSSFNGPSQERFGGPQTNGILGNGMRGSGGMGGSIMGSNGGQRDQFGGHGGQTMGGMSHGGQEGTQQGAVLMVYGLNKDKMNADRLFNLLCLYGNVDRVKFLKTKEGCAMVQMGDGLAVERAVANLNNTTFFGSKMQLGYSKQAFLADVQQPFELPDKTPSFKYYLGNKKNRFINPEMASKNRIQPPSRILHFFNTPPGLQEDQLLQIFIDADVTPPKSIHLLPSKTERSSRGLLEFNDIPEALDALIVGNHVPVSSHSEESKFPFTMKLCFSSTRHMPSNVGD